MAKNNYEQMRITERLKEFRTLYIFIILASIIALLLMNILIFPIAVFAAKKPHLFSSTVKWGTAAVFLTYAGFKIVSEIRKYAAGKFSIRSYFASSAKKRIHSCIYGIILFFAAVFLILFIYIVMKYNYYILYEILN